MLEELKYAKYIDLEDMIYRSQLINNEIIGVLDLKNNPTKRIGFSLTPGRDEIFDISQTLEYFLPDNVEETITIADKRVKSNSKNLV